VRQAAREAIESVGMRPVMAEMAGARPQSPRQALLAEVAAADICLLILGQRYGTPCASGLSPTEEEFEEAKRRNKPIVVLRQEVEMEPERRKFLTRSTGGSWGEGRRPSATPLLQRAREIRRWLGIRRTGITLNRRRGAGRRVHSR
jgi:hypothetical protein